MDDSIAENCQTDTAALQQASVVGRQVLDSAELAQHQWRKHGSCSGLTPVEYFSRMRQLTATLQIPAPLRTVGPSSDWTLRQFEAAWQQANPQLDGARLAVRCKSGWLYELLFCFDDAGQLTRCPSGTRDSCPRERFGVRGTGA
jgi:ribonuclease T2